MKNHYQIGNRFKTTTGFILEVLDITPFCVYLSGLGEAFPKPLWLGSSELEKWENYGRIKRLQT